MALTKNNPVSEFNDIRRNLWLSTTGAIIIGIIMIALISIYLAIKPGNNFLSAFGSGVLIAGGSVLSGGFLGFIFGIPSILQDAGARLKYNDNLVQISDWLTKIIVGVGLTQLYNIPAFIRKVGEHFQTNFGNEVWGRNVAIAIIGYFFILGFLMIYFWTKTDYSTVMKTIDDDFNQLKADLKTANREKDQAQLEKKEMANDVSKKETQERVALSPLSATSNGVDYLPERYKEQVALLKQLVEKTLPQKPVVHQDDIQKERWGANAVNNEKKITATVAKNAWQNLFDVTITIASADKSPLNDPAAIFVHDSYEFANDVIYTTPSPDGILRLSLLASEAFTVGVLFADNTQLELDLNMQKGFPADFYVPA
jgi:hypothetical protein